MMATTSHVRIAVVRLFMAAGTIVASSCLFFGQLTFAETLTPQVQIEAKLVEVSRNTTRELGIDARIADALGKLSSDASNLSSSQATALGLGASPSTKIIDQRFFPDDAEPGNINLTGLLTREQSDAILKAFDHEKGVNVIAQPVITIPSNQPANVYVPQSVGFSDGGLILEIKPRVNADGSMEMTFNPRIQSVTGNEPQQRAQDEQKSTNDVTIGLGQIPVLGGLFVKDPPHKRNLLLFITAQPMDVLSHSNGSGKEPEKVKVETIGTGETIGHVADLKLQNLSDGSLVFVIPALLLESKSGKNQDYACPQPQEVTLTPHQTKIVPLEGVCINRDKPPVEKGGSGELVLNTVDPGVAQHSDCHITAKAAGGLLRICQSIYDAVDQVQKSGELKDFPYKNKKEQREILLQWTTWTNPRISEISKTPAATKEDLTKVVYKQVEEKGTPSSATKKKIDKGIDTIFEKIEITGEKAKELETPDLFQNVELTGKEAKGENQPVDEKKEEPKP